jgi:hypothetical protein
MRILYGKSYSLAQGQLLLRSMTKSLFAWEDREDTEVPWIKQEQVEAYEYFYKAAGLLDSKLLYKQGSQKGLLLKQMAWLGIVGTRMRVGACARKP